MRSQEHIDNILHGRHLGAEFLPYAGIIDELAPWIGWIGSEPANDPGNKKHSHNVYSSAAPQFAITVPPNPTNTGTQMTVDAATAALTNVGDVLIDYMSEGMLLITAKAGNVLTFSREYAGTPSVDVQPGSVTWFTPPNAAPAESTIHAFACNIAYSFSAEESTFTAAEWQAQHDILVRRAIVALESQLLLGRYAATNTSTKKNAYSLSQQLAGTAQVLRPGEGNLPPDSMLTGESVRALCRTIRTLSNTSPDILITATPSATDDNNATPHGRRWIDRAGDELARDATPKPFSHVVFALNSATTRLRSVRPFAVTDITAGLTRTIEVAAEYAIECHPAQCGMILGLD